ncbi:hypothetical protein FB384_004960 [Prauserella sediminis]|uniref:Major capsid protein n=1 Tax=Prauserella sediminis TaxID=577680 RepID=A0A839XTG8_9PSEU|nr:major capsid protein [Prauserella sediminis]MBB3666001.1 hypothetical protein [Prauserella sediminis]
MDHLTDLLNHATSAESDAGQQRVQELIAKLREIQDVDLSELETAATGRFEELYAEGEYAPDQVSTLEALADVTDAVRTLDQERKQARDEQDRRVGALADRVRTTTDEAESEQDTTNAESTDDDGAAPTEEGGAAAPPAQPTLDSTQQDADSGTDGTEGTTPQIPEQTARETSTESDNQPIAASDSTQRPSTASALNSARSNSPAKQEKKTMLTYSITAAAEVPDMPFGKALTTSEMAEAALARYATFPEGQPTNGPIKANVARITRTFSADASTTGSEMADAQIIDKLADETRLPGGSLVAAANTALTAADQAPSVVNDIWCSPSEVDWNLCPQMATTAGILDLPTAGLPRRGGIRYPIWDQYPEQPDAWRGTVIDYPEADPAPDNSIANPNYFHSDGPGGTANLKTCISGPCVSWAEERMSLAYLCVTSDILRDRTFPELTERFISDVLIHHQHYLNSHWIQRIYNRSDELPAFDVANALGSSAEAVLDRIPLLVTWFRNAYRMSDTQTLEIVAPVWFREFLKRDIERKSNRPHGSVSNAEVQALFAGYASRVQWVYDWQDLPSTAGAGNASGKVMPDWSADTGNGGWPNGVEMIAYPAGSWVLFQGNILNLGVQYDYTLLRENRYSAMFSEDAWMLLNRCNRSFRLRLTNLCANGSVGPSLAACPPATTEPAPAGDGSTTG